MSFQLTIDGPAWDSLLKATIHRRPGLVPVIKGNGYGFGTRLLAQRCEMLGVSTVAVGVPAEIPVVRSAYAGEILVMAPLLLSEAANYGPPRARVVRTVGRADVVEALSQLANPPRVVLELDSPMHRHGVRINELPSLLPALSRLPLAGLALHLPTEAAGRREPGLVDALRALTLLRTAEIDPGELWVSHLSPPEVARLAERSAGVRIRPRVGTSLWLGDRTTFRAEGTVLDVHPLAHPQVVGYRQRRSAAGTLVVVSGGTGHGVGLQAAAVGGRWRDLARAAVAGAAHGAGLTASPFHWAGRRLRYADVPHMQVSMVLVPAGIRPPEVGDRLVCDVRMTVTTFDEVHVQGPADAMAA